MRRLKDSSHKSLSRRDFVTGVTAGGAAIGAASLLSGCMPFLFFRESPTTVPSDVAVSKSGGALAVASYWPSTLDPCYLGNYVDFQISTCLFDTLVRYDYQTEKLVPAAAESWKASADGSTFTFKLVEGATFHNGDPVTAQDFVYAWHRLLKPDSEGEHSPNAFPLMVLEGAAEFAQGEADEVSGIRAIDKLTLELALLRPFFDFPVTLTYPALAPVPSKGATRSPEAFAIQPVGNGAFQMDEDSAWTASALELVRFEEYYGQPALVNYLEFWFYEDDSNIAQSPEEFLTTVGFKETADKQVADKQVADGDSKKTAFEKAYEDFELGMLDYTEIPVEELEEALIRYGESRDGYSAAPGEQTLSGQEASTQFLDVNFFKEPLNDANVRKAISYAIDRGLLSETLSNGAYLEANGIVPPGVEGFRDGAWEASYYNPSRAKQALTDAGFPEGKGLTTISLVYGGDGFEKRLFEQVQSDLAAVGIQSQLVRWDTPEQTKSPRELIFETASLSFSGWIIDYPLMESFITPFFTTDGVYNPFGYSNELVDEGIRVARETKSPTLRIRAYQDVEDIISEDMPLIPLLFPTFSSVCSDRTNDLVIRPDRIVELSKIWVSS